MRAFSFLMVSSFVLLGCDSDRSTGGGGVQQVGRIDSGVPASNRDASSGDVVIGGGGSGVNPSKFLDELTAPEKQTLCEWRVPAQGGPGTYQCSEDVSVTIETVAECIADTFPHCTVGQAEACVTSLMGDPCAFFSSGACAAFLDCLSTSPPPSDAGVEDASAPDNGGE